MASGQRNGVLKTAALVVTLLAALGGGFGAMELRYAKAADIVDIKVEILESRRQSIRREIFSMEQIDKTRRDGLTAEEKVFLDGLRQQYQEVSQKIERLSK
jgi:hypothetical protein